MILLTGRSSVFNYNIVKSDITGLNVECSSKHINVYIISDYLDDPETDIDIYFQYKIKRTQISLFFYYEEPTKLDSILWYSKIYKDFPITIYDKRIKMISL